MNKQRFIEYLHQPSSLNDQTLNDLEKVLNEYPYFQSARTLLAKGSKLHKSKNAARVVNSAAIYATDRALLKRYINDELIFLNPLEVHESHEADHDRELSQVIKTKRITEAKSKIRHEAPEVTPVPEKKPAVAVKMQEQPTKGSSGLPSRPSNLDAIIEELYRDMEELKVNRTRFSEMEKRLEEEDAVSEAVQKATKKADKQPEVNKAEVKKASESASARKAAENVAAKDTARSKTAKKASTKSVTRKTAKTKKSSTKKTSAPEQQSETQSTGSEKKDDKGEPGPLAQADIIAAFIQNNPSIPQGGGKLRNDVDLSGDSTVFHPDTASEYLAEIYLEQGKKDRAAEIYQALMLKFPEKKSYFAGLIENLK